EPLGDQVDDELIGYELAERHELVGALPELRAGLASLAKHITRRDLRNPELRAQALRLGALPRARGPDEDEIRLRHGTTPPSARGSAGRSVRRSLRSGA